MMENESQTIYDLIQNESYPWLNPPEQYAIAITGRAFNHLIKH